MAKRGTSAVLLIAIIGWALFGSWALWSNEVLGHAVAFFFFSTSLLGLGVQLFGLRRGLLPSVALLVAIAGASEYLQPRFTTRPAEWADVISDLVGVGAGVVVVVIAALSFRRADWPWAAFGLLCLAALGGSLFLASSGSDLIDERFEARVGCWGKGLEADSSVVDGPIIRVEGQTFNVGDGASLPLSDGILIDDSADFRCSIAASGSYSIVATVVPDSIQTGGPMRIFASSVGIEQHLQNTHLGQEFDMLSVRIGSDSGLQWESVPDVFVAGQRVTVAMVVGDGQVNVFVDGEWRASFDLESDAFNEWDADFPILVGDEFSRNRTFEGVIESVLVFDRLLAEGDLDLSVPGS